MLLDKGFYDYDYKPLGEFKVIQELPDETHEQTQKEWGRFVKQKENLKQMSMDELQQHAINDLEKNN